MGVHDGHRKRTRERCRKTGLDSFADHEALELLLYYTLPRQDTNPIAHALMDRFGSLDAVFSAPIEVLMQVTGVGETTAFIINLVPQLIRKARLERYEKELALTSASSVGAYLLELFSNERNEVLYQLCLDGKGRLLACKQLGVGGVSSVSLDIRRLVENALLTSASAVILAHNHPSGLALPSEEDHTATEQAQRALETIGVSLVDHIIVADRDYTSFASSGYLIIK